MGDTSGMKHCPQCGSAEFYWDQERWLHYCNDCGYELDPDDQDGEWLRCFDCDYLFWTTTLEVCPACTGTTLLTEEGFMYVIHVAQLP